MSRRVVHGVDLSPDQDIIQLGTRAPRRLNSEFQLAKHLHDRSIPSCRKNWPAWCLMTLARREKQQIEIYLPNTRLSARSSDSSLSATVTSHDVCDVTKRLWRDNVTLRKKQNTCFTLRQKTKHVKAKMEIHVSKKKVSWRLQKKAEKKIWSGRLDLDWDSSRALE